jgi:hypothetical protein
MVWTPGAANYMLVLMRRILLILLSTVLCGAFWYVAVRFGTVPMVQGFLNRLPNPHVDATHSFDGATVNLVAKLAGAAGALGGLCLALDLDAPNTRTRRRPHRR